MIPVTVLFVVRLPVFVGDSIFCCSLQRSHISNIAAHLTSTAIGIVAAKPGTTFHTIVHSALPP